MNSEMDNEVLRAANEVLVQEAERLREALEEIVDIQRRASTYCANCMSPNGSDKLIRIARRALDIAPAPESDNERRCWFCDQTTEDSGDIKLVAGLDGAAICRPCAGSAVAIFKNEDVSEPSG